LGVCFANSIRLLRVLFGLERLDEVHAGRIQARCHASERDRLRDLVGPLRFRRGEGDRFELLPPRELSLRSSSLGVCFANSIRLLRGLFDVGRPTGVASVFIPGGKRAPGRRGHRNTASLRPLRVMSTPAHRRPGESLRIRRTDPGRRGARRWSRRILGSG